MAMKRRVLTVVLGLAMAVTLLAPAAAFAGASTDAALGLGAFAVFNQMLAGVGVFGPPRAVVVAPPPAVVEAPPPVVVAPPPVVVAPPPAVVYPYAYPTYYYGYPAYYAAPVYYGHPRHYHRGGWAHARYHRHG